MKSFHNMLIIFFSCGLNISYLSHIFIRVDHISKKCAKHYSKLFIPFLDIRIDTKKIYSSIRVDLGVPQAAFPFSLSLRGEFHQNLDFLFSPSRSIFLNMFQKKTLFLTSRRFFRHPYQHDYVYYLSLLTSVIADICHC